MIELRSADTLNGRVMNGEEVRELSGHVHFVQQPDSGGIVHVWCDRALRYTMQNKMELYGNVKMIQDSVTIHSKEGVYYGERRMMTTHTGVRLERGKSVLTAQVGEYFVDEKRSHFTGNVMLVDSSSTIWCDELQYYQKESRSVATGNVHAFQYSSALNMYGDSLVHLEQQKFSHVLKHPRLVKIDTAENKTIDTMVIVSKEMKSYKDSVERFVAIDSVQMAKHDLSARCALATYYVSEELITLQTHPMLWSGDNQITGDSMRVRMENKKLRSLWVKNHAVAVSRADSLHTDRYNQLTGKELTMYFHSDKLEQIDVQRNATSLYYTFDKKDPNGANKTSGDRIFIDFVKGEIDRIKVVGGVQGQYFPEKMISRHEADYNLDGFRWYTNRPERRGVFIISK
ncbi:MAG TPA: OstA-like protein [Bacteroidota bacterium]|nr:OstA-like protein [Bacteroidota bacterium]